MSLSTFAMALGRAQDGFEKVVAGALELFEKRPSYQPFVLCLVWEDLQGLGRRTRGVLFCTSSRCFQNLPLSEAFKQKGPRVTLRRLFSSVQASFSMTELGTAACWPSGVSPQLVGLLGGKQPACVGYLSRQSLLRSPQTVSCFLDLQYIPCLEQQVC